MIVGLDVDDVVADLISEWLKRYRERSGHNLWPSDIRDWDISDYATKMPSHEFYGILHEPDLYAHIKPMPQALTAVTRIREAGHRIVFISACVGTSAHDKKEWLVHHGFLKGRDKHKDFVAAHDKSLVTGVDILVDDRIENVESFPKKAILIRRPHNEGLMCWRARGHIWEVPDLIEIL